MNRKINEELQGKQLIILLKDLGRKISPQIFFMFLIFCSFGILIKIDKG